MSQDLAFIREICTAPDDDGPRLVYADWLEEQGDPRGEFIRGQCEMARLPLENARYRELESRTLAILELNDFAWRTAALRTSASKLSEVRYHRGFIERARMSLRYFLSHGNRLMEQIPLQSVELTAGEKLLPRLGESGLMRRLRELALHGNEFPIEAIPAFLKSPNLANLQTFRFRRQSLFNAALRAFAEAPFPKLTTLDFGGSLSGAGHLQFPTFLRAPWLRQLETLSLSECRMDHNWLPELADCGQFESLTCTTKVKFGFAK